MIKIQKKIEYNPENKKEIEAMPKIYLVATWAKTGVWELPFAGIYEYDKYMLCDVPMVYQYDDFNGTEDGYWLRKITCTTTGFIIDWTFDKEEAQRMADEMNARSKL